MTPEQQAYVEKELALIERGGNCDHEAFVVDRIWGMGEDNLAKVDPPVVGLCNTDDSYYIQYFKNREEIEKFIEAVRKAADEAWGPSEKKREALSEKAIGLESELIRKRLLGSQGLTEFGWFEMGVRFAERHHGIGGEG